MSNYNPFPWVADVRRRFGPDFDARIDRVDRQLQRRAQSGDLDAVTALERRNAIRDLRRSIWRELVETQASVNLLREETFASAYVNSEPARGALPHFLSYTDVLRHELQRTEERLAQLLAEHHTLVEALATDPLASDTKPALAAPR